MLGQKIYAKESLCIRSELFCLRVADHREYKKVVHAYEVSFFVSMSTRVEVQKSGICLRSKLFCCRIIDSSRYKKVVYAYEVNFFVVG